MDIHVVRAGETLYEIAGRYGVSPERLALDNGLENPTRLVTGQTLVILYPERSVTVQPGETLSAIAAREGVTVNPVSYTHLDVYKRQGIPICRPLPKPIHATGL